MQWTIGRQIVLQACITVVSRLVAAIPIASVACRCSVCPCSSRLSRSAHSRWHHSLPHRTQRRDRLQRYVRHVVRHVRPRWTLGRRRHQLLDEITPTCRYEDAADWLIGWPRVLVNVYRPGHDPGVRRAVVLRKRSPVRVPSNNNKTHLYRPLHDDTDFLSVSLPRHIYTPHTRD